MCSILGGTKLDEFGLKIYHKAKDRGRDFTSLVEQNGLWICNHRATPTNEKLNPLQNQPFGIDYKIVHNGTVSNDKECDVLENELDSKAFANVLDVENIYTIKETLKKIQGSFSIAILKDNEIILACNYKPIFYLKRKGEIYFSSLKEHLGKNAIRVKPYSVMNLKTEESVEIDRNQPDRALIVCSGGLDSTAVTGYAFKKHKEMKLVHFDYGCKATEKEINSIQSIAEYFNIEYEVLNLDYTKFKGTSTLFQEGVIETGKNGVEYALDWVYARNLVMLSVATAYAEANQFGYIYLGSNLEESGAYPDNEEQFMIDFNSLLYGAVNNGYKVELITPLGGLMKKEIVTFGVEHDSPIHLSWSCYNNLENHCGKCGPCYMRKKAFSRAKVKDKTIYGN
ncbi:MAG: putative 7-cyano-7-deazaguanine synthase [Prokaryotic dsDNA virus sp.]|nr:MAG: putative 7-cyano-7-deazaguanine synthase [Prokaryotic dsDNA virus sp.]QDP65565.1 MAG: putative 7-cyano-7-deazaguanine synthase [Prokaryotic dsDNA virus sp.]|tara:strand:- start:18727 stop:19914 length:1188 start_codon:yes stop_codon:yes gene_type:complete